MTIKNRELETTVRELQSKQKTLMIVTVVALVIMIGSVIALLMN
ncbi:hypothetical protein ACOBWA_04685 [Psychrobacter sp. ER1]